MDDVFPEMTVHPTNLRIFGGEGRGVLPLLFSASCASYKMRVKET